MKECKRCGQMAGVSAIGAVLYHFVCDTCRLDNAEFHYGHDTTRKAMEYQLVIRSSWSPNYGQ